MYFYFQSLLGDFEMSEMFENGKTPEDWSDSLRAKGIKLSPRTLRLHARKHRQFYSIGRLMILSPAHIENMLTAEATNRQTGIAPKD